MEATTGWRFLVEEIQRVGAEAHLAEPAETSALKGKKQRAKTDWADGRHLRELLLIGRLPESWIAPAHLLDLRPGFGVGTMLVHQRTEWQQRMHAVLYHHGVPHTGKLLTLAKPRACRRSEAPERGPGAAHDRDRDDRDDRAADRPGRYRAAREEARKLECLSSDVSHELQQRGGR